ncbi:DUF3015 family protein [Pleionea sp. CnH1-48]|uniref:DUF3015 family protein n=1 Tax=Pleionea sp. CnH1-48 TaxID=2954494 RepID=UPI002096E7D1|nr:DUF3015 family protein [Pleionea sp. CnH1-48]MCO7223586.1 DUF3015 domain-containing protein [Pleionea sp. CnH1-48]
MKKLIASVAVLSLSSMAYAGSGPGCGLGASLFKGKSGVGSHVSAATTNGTSGNQTFGMTSGTSGCNTSQSIQFASLYMEKNVDKVAVDMSKGEGEALNALAELLGISTEHKAEFNTLVKDNFNQIFTSEKTTSGQAMDNMVALMKQSETLKQYAS